MKNKLYIIALVSILTFGSVGVALAAPGWTYQRTLLPETNNAFDLGTTTQVWRNAYITQLCLSADCKTIWPSGVGTVSTSTVPTVGQLAYWTSAATPSLLGSVATGTISASGGITATAGQSIIGSGLTIGCTAASAGATGCLSSTDWSTFNGKQATISATWPITLSGATVGFNGLSTSTAAVIGNIPYFSGVNTFANVATTTPTFNLGLTSGGTWNVLGSAPTLSVATSSLYSGTTGQFPYFSGTNALTATSSIFINTAGNIGIGTTTPTLSTERGISIDSATDSSSIRLSAGMANGNMWEWQSTVVSGTAAMNLSNLSTVINPLTILGNGNVGIASTSPSSRFSIGTSGSAFRIDSTGTVKEGVWNGTTITVANGGTGIATLSGMLQGNGTNPIVSITGDAGSIPYYTGTATLLATSTVFISTTGLVGVGATDGIAKFQVNGTPVTGTQFNLFSVDTTALAANVGGGIGFGGNFTGSTKTAFSYIQGIKENATDGNFDGAMRFITRSTATGFAEALRITSTGLIGLGTTTPASFIFPTVKPAIDISSAAGAGLAGIIMHDRDTAQESGFGTNGANFVMAVAGHATATNNNITFQTEETNSQYTPTERMRIDSTGRLGIGTSSPNTLLQIYSTATSTMSVDSNSPNKGGCVELKDSDGVGYTYITGNNGVLTGSVISCK